jgi:hypothetical protein
MVITMSLECTASGVRTFGGCGGDVDADFSHRRDGDRVDLIGWFGSGGADCDAITGEVS